MLQANYPRFDSAAFTYNAKKMVLTTEASTIQFTPAREILLRSHVTGQIEKFVLTQVDRCTEGEVRAWNYRGVGLMAAVTVTIYND